MFDYFTTLCMKGLNHVSTDQLVTPKIKYDVIISFAGLSIILIDKSWLILYFAMSWKIRHTLKRFLKCAWTFFDTAK